MRAKSSAESYYAHHSSVEVRSDFDLLSNSSIGVVEGRAPDMRQRGRGKSKSLSTRSANARDSRHRLCQLLVSGSSHEAMLTGGNDDGEVGG